MYNLHFCPIDIGGQPVQSNIVSMAYCFKTICPIIHTTPTKSCFNEILKLITIKCFLIDKQTSFSHQLRFHHFLTIPFLHFFFKLIVNRLYFKFNSISPNRLASTINPFFLSASHRSESIVTSLYNAFPLYFNIKLVTIIFLITHYQFLVFKIIQFLISW